MGFYNLTYLYSDIIINYSVENSKMGIFQSITHIVYNYEFMFEVLIFNTLCFLGS